MNYDVAIIGGGFSGAAVAFYLLGQPAKGATPRSVVIFDPCKDLGAGIAYRTQCLAHLLNVTASKMSIDVDAPLSFVRWLGDHAGQYGPDDFVPRVLFYQYVNDTLTARRKERIAQCSLTHILSEITKITRSSEGFVLQNTRGEAVQAKAVILAIGNSPEGFQPPKSDEVLKQPWNTESFEHLLDAKKIGVIGSALTAVDMILGLEAAGYKGKYLAISRHGEFPRAHPESVSADKKDAVDEVAQKIERENSLRGMLRTFRGGVGEGIPWAALIDALRPRTQLLWQKLHTKDKQRFLRHVRHVWDSHRHRIPQKSLRTMHELENSGRLEIVPGRLVRSHAEGSETVITVRHRAEDTVSTLRVTAAFDCRGLFSNLTKCRSPLLSNIISEGLVTYDELSLGLKADTHGNLLGRDGLPVPRLYTLGSMRRGELWESSAAREIRAQAAEIAVQLSRVNS